MPQTRDIALEQLAAAGEALAAVETRVDAAHSLGDALANLPHLAEMPVDLAITEMVRVEGVVQLQSQADQLGAHLAERQRNLDNRQAQLHASQAEFEREVREAKLWLAERDSQLSEREARLREREAGLQVRTDGSWGDLSRPPPISGDRQPGEEWDERKRALARQSEQIDRRRLALEEVREEISRMHQEALELRITAEELHAQLRASLGVDSAEESLRAARQRLAQRYHNEAAQLTRRRDELEWLKNDLAQEHAKLERRYEEFKLLMAGKQVTGKQVTEKQVTGNR